ncbi:MAG TPA: hypothetical protein VF753_12875 [Terriglobales bacterium]
MSHEPATPNLKDLLGTLEESPDVSFVLDPQLCLVYRNQAWNNFASENCAPELATRAVIGTDLRKIIGHDLLPFYNAAFEQVERDRTAWECQYECSSPQLFRKFRMQIQSLGPFGYLVRNSLVVERPHAPSSVSEPGDYVSADSIISLCMHCRCSRRIVPPYRWDFVPAHLDRNLTNISHALCPVCLEYFYPKAPDEQ